MGDDRVVTCNYTGWEASAFVEPDCPASMTCGDGKVCGVHGAILQNYYNPFLVEAWGHAAVSSGPRAYKPVNYPLVNPTSER